MKTTLKQINVGHRCAECGSCYNEVDEYLYTHKELRATGHKQHNARTYSIEFVTENCEYCLPDADATDTMNDRPAVSSMTWKDRYDAMKEHYGYTDADVATITGHTAAAVRQLVTTKQREFPRWLRLAIVNFEKEHPTHDSPQNIPPDNPADGGTD